MSNFFSVLPEEESSKSSGVRRRLASLGNYLRSRAPRFWIKMMAFCVVAALLSWLCVRVNAVGHLLGTSLSCSDCHVMKNHYDAWLKSPHANPEPLAAWPVPAHSGTAQCADCHEPHGNLFRHYMFKAKTGLHNVKVNMAGTVKAEDLKATDESRRIIEANCRRCHDNADGSLNSGIECSSVEPPEVPGRMRGRACLDCHANTSHDLGKVKDPGAEAEPHM